MAFEPGKWVRNDDARQRWDARKETVRKRRLVDAPWLSRARRERDGATTALPRSSTVIWRNVVSRLNDGTFLIVIDPRNPIRVPCGFYADFLNDPLRGHDTYLGTVEPTKAPLCFARSVEAAVAIDPKSDALTPVKRRRFGFFVPGMTLRAAPTHPH